MIRWKHVINMDTENPADNLPINNSMKLPSIAAANQDAAAAANEGNVYYDETSKTPIISNGTSWDTISTAAAASLDAAYNLGSSIAVDTGDVDFVFTVNKDVSIINNAASTQAIGLKVDAANAGAGCVITDAISVLTSGASATVTDAIDVSDAGITNAINVGANVILGTTATINLNNFDVAATGEVTSADDVNCVNVVASGDVGAATLTVSGAVAFTSPPVSKQSDITAGTAAVTAPAYDQVYSIATDDDTDCTVTLNAGAVVGYDITIHFVTDGTKDVVVAVGGADTIDGVGDLANTGILCEDVGDYLVLRKVSADKWIVVENNGGTLS